MLKPFLKVPCNLQPEEEEKWLREQLKAPLQVESFFFFSPWDFLKALIFHPKVETFFPPRLDGVRSLPEGSKEMLPRAATRPARAQEFTAHF